MENTIVSIIVTCYNQGNFLGDALGSVLKQTYKNWECIIIDDGSVDDSEEVARNYMEKDSRFKYIYQENQGVVAARNNAIAASCGKYILPLDGDDMIAKDYLQLAVPVMDNDSSVGLVYCDVKMFGNQEGDLILRPLNMRNILACGCCVNASMFRRTDFDKVGGFKECMKNGWEDWDLFVSLLEYGVKVYKINKCLFFYRKLCDSRDNTIIDKNYLISLLVSNHSLSYYNEYTDLLFDYEQLLKTPFIRDGIMLYKDRPLFRRLIHLCLIMMKWLNSLLKFLRI